MSKELDMRLPWQKAYENCGDSSESKEANFRAGYYAGMHDKENMVIARFEKFVRDYKVDK